MLLLLLAATAPLDAAAAAVEDSPVATVSMLMSRRYLYCQAAAAALAT
jgi:energy-converting hydrogenase Eha subunit C